MDEEKGYAHIEVLPFRLCSGDKIYVSGGWIGSNMDGHEILTVDALEITGSNEVKWDNPKVHMGLYVYLVEAELENGETRQFRSMLEVQK